MGNQLQYDETSADRATVAALLAQANEVGDLLGAAQFGRRLQMLDARLAAFTQGMAQPEGIGKCTGGAYGSRVVAG